MSLRSIVQNAVSSVQSLAGEAVVYRRGNVSAALRMLPGSAARPEDAVKGLSLQPELQDWLIGSDQLLLNDVPICPSRGDLIVVDRDGKTLTFEVLPSSEQPYRMDATGALIRIHTRLRTRA